MHIIGQVRTAVLCLTLGAAAAAGQTMQVYEIDGHDLLIHVNPALHQRYGLAYPVTYVVQFPSDRTGLHAYVRDDTTSAWTALQTKLPTDYFNGIDAVRFDYTTSTAYVSATLSESSDDLNIHITDGTGEPVRLSYRGVAQYYDNRSAAVLVGIDDWKDYTDTQFLRLNAILRSYNLAFTAAILTGDCTDSTYAHIQTELNAGMFEAASHTRNHPRWPYDNLEEEIDGSRTDLLNNLIFPRQFRKGDTEYLYSFVVPYGETSAEIETVVTHSGYLNDRVVGYQSGLYTGWDKDNGRFLWDGTTKEMGPPWGSTDENELNAAFDSRIAEHRIYHLLIHPYGLEAAGEWDKPYIPAHLAHISNRTDIWYTTFGHLYVYRLLGDSAVGETVWPVTAPFVTTDPLSHNVVEGSTVTFTCGATGSAPLTYQWQKNRTNIAGATTSSYVLATAMMTDSGSTFRCIVRNAQGADTSASALLTVVSAGSGSGIVSDDFNAQALNTSLWQFVNPLHDVSLAMTGGGTQDARVGLTIPAGTAHDIWTTGAQAPRLMQPSVDSDLEIEAKFDATESAPLQMQGLLIQQDSLNFVRFDIVRDTPQLGLFAATFSDGVPTEQLDMGVSLTAPYYLRVKRVGDGWTCLYSSDGTTWIEAVTFTHVLTVRQVGVWAGNAGSPAPAFTGLVDYFFNTLSPIVGEDGPDLRTRPVVSSDPATVTVLQGQPASFTTAAGGTAPLSYQWQKNGINISGATGTVYNIAAASRSDSGSTFRCIVSNIVGKDTSAGAILNVNPLYIPVILREPRDTTVLATQSIVFSVAATGTRPFTYRWQKNGTNISGATDSVYTITSALRADSGAAFRCIVSNIGGNDTSRSAVLHVLTLVIASITREPLDSTVYAGQPAGFSVAATGTSPLIYRWQKNGTDIPSATDSLYIITSALRADSGATFRCIVSNIGGIDTSRSAVLGVLPVFAAEITREPRDTTAYAGRPAGFSLAATGTAPLGYRWQKNGTDIPNATDSVYSITSTLRADSGVTFRCIVSNFAGNDTSASAVLKVLPVFIASIIREPADTSVFAGQPASFNIAATGTAPLSYHWQRNGADIPDATDSLYAIASTAQMDSGATFRCIVTNIGGNDTSATATLRVSPRLVPVPAGVRLVVSVLLQGAMVGDSMRTDLHASGVIPLTHPFEATVWGTVQGDTIATVPVGMVDWILIELRSGLKDSTMRIRQAALLLKNGTVTATDGISPLYFPTVPFGSYYVVVRHRNHLTVMSAAPVKLDSVTAIYDFTTSASQYFGAGAAALPGGRFGMVAGDADRNRGIGGTDLAFIRLILGPSPVYGAADVDLNGIVGMEDLLLTRTNIGRTTDVP